MRRTMASDLTFWLCLTVSLVSFVIGAGYYVLVSRALSARLAAEAEQTVDELAEVLVLPLYNLDDEVARRTAEVYLGSDRVSGLRIVSSSTGLVFDNLAGASSSLPVLRRRIRREGLELGTVELVYDDAEIQSIRKHVVRTTAVATAVVILILSLVMRFVLRSIVVTPLTGLIRRLDEMAGGDYAGRLPPVPQADLNAIVTAANRMFGEIAERNRRLAESEQTHREIFNSTGDAIFIHDARSGAILDVNRTAIEMYGYSREELAGLKVGDLSLGRPPYSQEDAGRLIRKAMEGAPQLFEWRARRRGGELFWVEVALKRTVLGGRTVVMAVVRDITERKALEDELRQSQKIEAIGVLAGGIAHDFNNILFAIIGYTELAMMQVAPDSEAAEHLRQIEKASERARELVQQILTFSRRQDQEKRPLRLSLIVKEALQLLRSSIPATIEIRQDIRTESSVLADPGQMHQLLVNLCTNAYHAIRDGSGLLTVRLHDTVLDEADLNTIELDRPGRYVILEVSDTGCGMDGDVLEKIFEPYFTTKEKGKGTGLGLAVVHGIVKSHQGRIAVYSEPGKGSTFRVYLPALEAGESASGPSADPPEIPRPAAGGRIMLVDDEEAIRSLAVRFLEDAGYRVEAFEDAEAAWSRFAGSPMDWDLLVTDQAMPRVTGAELVERVRGLRPDLPVILCTGFSDQINGEQARAMGIDAYLQKPLTRRELLRHVAGVMRRDGEGGET